MAGMELFDLLDRMPVVDAPVVWPNHHADMDDPPPPHRLVASHDIVRTDLIGRRYVVVPKGQPPEHRVRLTEQEEATLIEPPEPPPDGTLEPGHCGFTLRNVSLGGFTIE